MQNFLKILPQYLVPQHTFTRFFNWLCHCRWRWLKQWMIDTFIRKYNVDMSAAVIENPNDYPTFNLFFTRHLKPELRPIVQGQNQIACPVDGEISQIGEIYQESLFQAKNFYFNLETLLGGDPSRAQPFINGNYATIYLSPKDYHRIHMPISGKLCQTVYIPGKLFSVNQFTTSQVPNLFARNERLVCIFDTAIGPMAVILVGAMIVGSIHTSWDAAPRSSRITQKTYEHVQLKKGDEIGYFQLGSTVIVLFPQDTMQWQTDFAAGRNVIMGELLGSF